jgi:hypothetical protein
MFEYYRGDWAYAEPNFFDELSKNFFLQNLHFGPIRWNPRRFLKISIICSQNLHFNLVFLSIFRKFIAHWAYEERISAHAQPAVKCEQFLHVCTIHAQHTRNEFYRTLSTCGTNFIACWAYVEPISSHAEHARKCLKVEYLGRIEYDFQKSRVTGPWDHIFSVFCKKSIKKISCLCTFNPSFPHCLLSNVCLPPAFLSVCLLQPVCLPADPCRSRSICSLSAN